MTGGEEARLPRADGVDPWWRGRVEDAAMEEEGLLLVKPTAPPGRTSV